jgi:hypothetical protein
MGELQVKIRKIKALIFACLLQRRKNSVFSFFVNKLGKTTFCALYSFGKGFWPDAGQVSLSGCSVHSGLDARGLHQQ